MPAVPMRRSDPDTDEAALFRTDGADVRTSVESAVAWGGARLLHPEYNVAATDAYGVVEAALAELDPVDAGLVTRVDIEGASFAQVVLELDLPSGEARKRLASARSKVRAALDFYSKS